jgi:hypothetical protein
MPSLNRHTVWVLICLSICLLRCTAAAQSHSSRPQPTKPHTFRIGLSYDEIVETMGQPPRGFNSYTRHTEANEYKINLRFSSDDSTSRLHPTRRLESAELVVDRPTSVKELLQDIPEAVELCEKGCSLLAVLVDNVGNYEPHIIAYVERPNEDQSRLAALIATHWRPDEARVQWVPAIVLKWKTKLPESVVPNWLEQPLETATFVPIAPSVETHRQSIFSRRPPIELGKWNPNDKAWQ